MQAEKSSRNEREENFRHKTNLPIPIEELIYRGDEMSGDVFFVP
jgi:hypothetical protein